jgi:hypothetical protein
VVSATVVALFACSSFDAADVPPGDEGGTSTTEASGGPEGAAGDSAPSSCVPSPIEVSDAGEDASCDGVTIILAESSQHCGRCGHDCLGASCVNGRCVIASVAQDQLTGVNVAAATATHLYFSTTEDSPGGPIYRYVRRLAFADAGVETLAAPGGGGYLHETAVEGATPSVFAILSDRGVIAVNVDQTPETTVVDDGNNNVGHLAVDATNLYWMRSGQLLARPRADVTNVAANIVVQGGSATLEPIAMIADGTKLYWSVRESGADAGAKTSIRVRGPGKTDSPSVKVASVDEVIEFAADAEFLYWSTPKGEIWRVLKATMATPELVTRVSGPKQYSKGLAVDDGYVYAAMTPSAQGGDLQMVLVQAPKCGGPPRVLAEDGTLGGLVAKDGYLYWGFAKTVRRIAK